MSFTVKNVKNVSAWPFSDLSGLFFCARTWLDGLLQGVVSVVVVPLGVSRSDQAVCDVHVQPLRLRVEHGHQDALRHDDTQSDVFCVRVKVSNTEKPEGDNLTLKILQVGY